MGSFLVTRSDQSFLTIASNYVLITCTFVDELDEELLLASFRRGLLGPKGPKCRKEAVPNPLML